MIRLLVILAALVAIACSDRSGDDEASTDETPPPVPEPAEPIDAAPPVALGPAPAVPPAPRGLPPTPSPEHNPTTAEKVALGKLLFFDTRLSSDGSASCATCHAPERGWGDPRTLSETVAGKTNLRHAPSLYNVAYQSEFYWDGRVAPLEALIEANWRGQLGAAPGVVASRLADNRVYRAHFRRAFGNPPSGTRIVEALAAFVRTIRSGDAPWDRYQAGDPNAVSPEAIAGGLVFRARADCAQCHPPPLYTDHGYHAVGVGDPSRDPGRGAVTNRASDMGAFKTPTLRGAMRSPPYFHDGSAASMEQVIEHFLSGEAGRPPITLSQPEKQQLLAFIEALVPKGAPMKPPELP